MTSGGSGGPVRWAAPTRLRSGGPAAGRRHAVHGTGRYDEPPHTPPVPFTRIRIRAGASVCCGEDVVLICRDRAESTHHTPPGGNVEPGEDLDAGLARELAEELGLDKALAEGGDLLWVVDQRVTRPGPPPPVKSTWSTASTSAQTSAPRSQSRSSTGARRRPRSRRDRMDRLPQDRRTFDLPTHRSRARHPGPPITFFVAPQWGSRPPGPA